MIKFINVEQVMGIYQGETYNFDRYNFSRKTPMSTQDISVTVDYKTGEISGEAIRYGEWGGMDHTECIQYLKALEPNQIKRPIPNL